MNDSPQDEPIAFSRELAELKRQLQEQLALLRDERLEELHAAMRHTTQRLQTLSGGAPAPAESAAEITEIRALHTELELALADKLSDTRTRLAHLNQGRRAVQAYQRQG